MIAKADPKESLVQTRYNGMLGHQTGQHWYIVMHDTTEDIIDYVTIDGTHGAIDAAIDQRIMKLIEAEETEHTLTFHQHHSPPTSKKRKHDELHVVDV